MKILTIYLISMTIITLWIIVLNLVFALLESKWSNSRTMIIDIFKTFISPGTKVALLDIADHWNLGDSYIFLGELLILKELKADIVYYSMQKYNLKELKKALGKDGIILFHGGGNFGDTYFLHQEFRMNTIKRFPKTNINILPQSIYYKTLSYLDKDKIFYSKYPKVRIFTRSNDSHKIIETHFPKNLGPVIPDSAVFIGSVKPACEPEYDIVYLSRKDLEKVVPNPTGALFSEFGSAYTSVVYDWYAWNQEVEDNSQIPGFYDYESLAHFRLKLGNKLLCKGRLVISDRLHAVILSLLMDKPVIAFDNNYGKIKSCLEVIQQAEGRDLGVKHASNYQEAYEYAKAILGEEKLDL